MDWFKGKILTGFSHGFFHGFPMNSVGFLHKTFGWRLREANWCTHRFLRCRAVGFKGIKMDMGLVGHPMDSLW